MIPISPMQLLSQIDRIPPFLCVAIATQVHRLTVTDIADRAKVSRRTVSRLNNMASWGSVRADLIDEIATACRVNLLEPKASLDMLKESQGGEHFNHLPSQQRVKVFEMFGRLRESRSEST